MAAAFFSDVAPLARECDPVANEERFFHIAEVVRSAPKDSAAPNLFAGAASR
jgi:hypothetical protein